jgi:hypothetical protein
MTEPLSFSYIAADHKQVDANGNHLVKLYRVWINNPETDLPVQTFQSIVPSVVVKIYPGNPYPLFDYTEALEGQVKFDIAQNAEYAALIDAQTNGRDWHLTPVVMPDELRAVLH